MQEKKRTKVAIIVGASHALKYKEKNPRASEHEVIQHITKEMDTILDQIDKELD